MFGKKVLPYKFFEDLSAVSALVLPSSVKLYLSITVFPTPSIEPGPPPYFKISVGEEEIEGEVDKILEATLIIDPIGEKDVGILDVSSTDIPSFLFAN